jgi:hypothetical protein
LRGGASQSQKDAARESHAKVPQLSFPFSERIANARAPREIDRFSKIILAAIDFPVNRFGVVADESAIRPPHPNAMRVADAVQSLDEFELCLPDGWDPFSDLRAAC